MRTTQPLMTDKHCERTHRKILEPNETFSSQQFLMTEMYILLSVRRRTKELHCCGNIQKIHVILDCGYSGESTLKSKDFRRLRLVVGYPTARLCVLISPCTRFLSLSTLWIAPLIAGKTLQYLRLSNKTIKSDT